MPVPNADDLLRTPNHAPALGLEVSPKVTTLLLAGVNTIGQLTLLRQDQRLRMWRGERPRLENHLKCHTDLRTDAVLDLAFVELVSSTGA
jgi:hypothetical protein